MKKEVVTIENKTLEVIKGGSRVWLIGCTGTGKSTLAMDLSQRLSLPILEAGIFARSISPNNEISVMSAISENVLQKDFRHFSRLIKEDIQDNGYIVAGVRNPVDFIDNFNPLFDWVLILEGEPKSEFEETGIAAIKSVLNFLIMVKAFDRSRLFELTPDKSKNDWYALSPEPTLRSCSDW